jgi:MerR family mercuric resistance operon transcriptional regulator
VHVETIRYYERMGLIARPRTVSGYRVYPEETLRRLRFIRNAQKLGFSLKEITELGGMSRKGASCAEMCARMDVKLAEIDEKIAQLTALRDQLAKLVDASPRQGSYNNCEVCSDMEIC